jgi:hypothetical protein
MQRRGLLKVGAGTAAALTLVAGASRWSMDAPRSSDGRFSPAAQQMFLAVGGSVLQGMLPLVEGARAASLQAWLGRLEATVAGMPPGVQSELDQLVLLLTSAPGRVGLTGLHTTWSEASADQVQGALRGLQHSTLPLRQQAFHALRDLSNAAYFSAPPSWALLGYPGPLKV